MSNGPLNYSDIYKSAEQGMITRPNSKRRVSAVKECNRLLVQLEDLKKASLRCFLAEGCGCCADHEEQSKAHEDLAIAIGAKQYSDNSGWNLYTIAYEILGCPDPSKNN